MIANFRYAKSSLPRTPFKKLSKRRLFGSSCECAYRLLGGWLLDLPAPNCRLLKSTLRAPLPDDFVLLNNHPTKRLRRGRRVAAPNCRRLIAKLVSSSPEGFVLLNNHPTKRLRRGVDPLSVWRESKRSYTVSTHFLKVLEGGTGESFFQEVSPESLPSERKTV